LFHSNGISGRGCIEHIRRLFVLIGASETAMTLKAPKTLLGHPGRVGLPMASLFRERKNEEVEALSGG
jgi:hypothetical protein